MRGPRWLNFVGAILLGYIWLAILVGLLVLR